MRRLALAFLAISIIAGAAFWIVTSPAMQRAGLEPVPAGAANLDNGRTLFIAGGCSSCHATPRQDDRTRLGGGLALPSPFGTFYPPNISPHPRDGIGSWTVAQFMRAMQAGVSPDGRHYYPAFPYTSYRRMTAPDLRDLFAHLKTLPPVEGRARGHDLPFPYGVRRLLGAWKFLFLDDEVFAADASKSAEWNRGAYLVEAAAHCAECHSPRNALGAVVDERRFSGGPNPDSKGFVPNITPHQTGIGGWSKTDIVEVLTTGFTPEYDSVGSTMAEVVRNTAQLSQGDREAIAAYVLSLPPREGRKREAK